MEDKENETVIKLVDKKELMREKEEKRMAEEQKRLEKELNKQAAADKKAALETAKKEPPTVMFKRYTDKYSKFNEQTGIPTHDEKGEELSKAQLKKLKKLWDQQNKKHKEYLASQIENLKL